MKSTVHIKRIGQYQTEPIESFLHDSLGDLFSGNPGFLKNQKVLLKPNLLRAADPEHCVTTHPVLLEALCRVLKDSGVACIDIGDSPAMGSLLHVARKSGYGLLEKKYGVRLVAFKNPTLLPIEDIEPEIKIAGNLSEYDAIINVPKVKSHRQMTLTLAIKNLFGCVVGKRKPVLHCLVQNDKIRFGKILVEIARHIAPVFTVADGIQAMEGNGPMHGRPYPLGLVFVAQDMTAMDRVISEILQVPLSRVFALEAAHLNEFGTYELNDIRLKGETDLSALKVSDFQLADFEMDISFNPLRLIKSYLKHFYEIGVREKLSS